MTDGRIDTWLLSIFAARVLMYANFMVYAACLPVLLHQWGMSATQAGTISSGFMLAYAGSLFVAAWLADRVGAKRVFLASAVLSTITALAFAFLARSYVSGLIFYTLAGSTQGGLYTPAIILFSDRYHSARRGTAMGYLIASTSIGYAFSLLVSGWCLHWSGYEAAFIATGILPILGTAVCWFALKDAPNHIPPRRERFALGRALRNRNVVYLVAGYTFHCWELLGMWSWTPAFFAAAAALTAHPGSETAQFGAYLTATMHVVGSFASASMGRLSDRLGRRAVLAAVAGGGALVSFSIGWLVEWPLYCLTLIGLVYYFLAIGDSPVLSTALSEATPSGTLGAVLAIRSLLGFAAGAAAPVAFGAVLDITNPDAALSSEWGWAFVTLGAGGLLAAVCAIRFRSEP